MKKLRRNQIKKPSTEALVLRNIRIEKGLSIRKAAQLMNRSGSWLAHIETGRFDPKESDLQLICTTYNIKRTTLTMKAQNPLPEDILNYRHECLSILKRLPEEKLKAIYSMIRYL